MTPNPTLNALGLAPDDRAVLIHTDDIGMCHASLAAYVDLSRSGTISAGSTMVPCPWFEATAQYCRAHPDTPDMGVHITLNSEWQTGYKWGAVSTCDPASGLLDDAGYLHATSEATRAHATPEAVRREIAAQVQKGLDAGIDVTHIDSHMGTVFYPGFIQAYLDVALAHQIPPFMVRNVERALRRSNRVEGKAEELVRMIQGLEAQGLPMFDDVRSITFDGRETHFEQTKALLDDLNPGLSYLIVHPSKETPELQAILPEGWEARVAEYESLMREELSGFLAEQGVHVLTWRTLRDLMREKQ